MSKRHFSFNAMYYHNDSEYFFPTHKNLESTYILFDAKPIRVFNFYEFGGHQYLSKAWQRL